VWSRYGGGQLLISGNRAVGDHTGGAIYQCVVCGPVLTRMEAWVSWTDTGGGGNADVALHSSNAVNGRIPGTDGHYVDFIHAVFGNQQVNIDIYQGGGPGPTLGGQAYSLPNNGTDGTIYYLGYELDVVNGTMLVYLPKATTKGVRPSGITTYARSDALITAVGGPYTTWQIYNTPAPNISPVFEAVGAISQRAASGSRVASGNRVASGTRVAS
jgi:hypothetical protein